MNNEGNIIVIENNQLDRKLFSEVFDALNFSNKVNYFTSGKEAYTYIITHKIKPFLIFSDIVLLHMEDYKLINRSYKNVSKELNCPYLFFSTKVEECFIIDAYSNPTKSYFVKPYEYEKFKNVIKTIVEYWYKEKTMPQHNEKKIVKIISKKQID